MQFKFTMYFSSFAKSASLGDGEQQSLAQLLVRCVFGQQQQVEAGARLRQDAFWPEQLEHGQHCYYTEQEKSLDSPFGAGMAVRRKHLEAGRSRPKERETTR